MTEKLPVDIQTKGDWIIDFPYKDKLLTVDFIRNLMKKQLLSLNEFGLDLFEEVLAEVKQEQAKLRPFSIDDPWGGDAA